MVNPDLRKRARSKQESTRNKGRIGTKRQGYPQHQKVVDSIVHIIGKLLVKRHWSKRVTFWYHGHRGECNYPDLLRMEWPDDVLRDVEVVVLSGKVYAVFIMR